MKDVVLLADKDSKVWGFANKIKEYIQNKYLTEVAVYDLPISFFRNKEIRFDSTGNLRKKDVYLIQDSSKNPQDWWVELLLAKDMINSSSAKSFSMILPNMLYSRQDRKDRPRVPLSARALADSISSGTNRIITMDLHARQIQGFYPATTPLDNLFSYPEAVRYLKDKYPDFIKDLLILSPDAGGVARANSFLKKLQEYFPKNHNFDIAFMSKERSIPGKVDKIRYSGNSPEEKNILIVDDILDSGGTLIKSVDELKKRGANKIYAYCCHGLFTEGVTKLKKSLDKIIISNTHYQNLKDIDIIDMSPVFGEAIFRSQEGKSISELFR